MQPVVIRRVDIRDALVRAAITSMHNECYEAADNPYTPEYGTWWIAFAGKEAVAFAGICKASQTPDAGYLCRAGVLPKFRGAGLQKRLIRIRVKYARQQGWSSVVTDTHKNPASSNSLISCGFRLFTPQRPWSFTTGLYWRKQL
jgi:ribosomal protein S18 acetylase RimI-like enzyme